MPMTNKKFYTDYVNHAVRFYMTTPDSLQLAGHSPADLANWVSVQTALSEMPQEDQELVRTVVGANEPTEMAVRRFADRYDRTMSDLWTVMNGFTKRVAVLRGLI